MPCGFIVMPMVLAFDVGTSYLKGAVVDINGRVLARAQVPVRPMCTEGADRHECDANTWLSGLALVTAQLRLRELDRMRAVIVSSNGPTLLPVSADGEALDAAMTWLDRRSVREAELISEFTETHVDASFYLPKALWIMRHKPDVYAQTEWFLPCAEFVTYFLTGNAFRVLPTLHFKEYFWNESAIPHVGLDEDKFPSFIEPGESAGTVRHAAEDAGAEDYDEEDRQHFFNRANHRNCRGLVCRSVPAVNC